VILCSNCKRPYPEAGVPYRCQTCGGVYEVVGPPYYDIHSIDYSGDGIWKYRSLFPLANDLPTITLGEGNTALVWGEIANRNIGFKLEYQNPTASFKDRGTSLITSYLKLQGVNSVIEDSSGNAGASLAAYSARAGIQASIYIPDSTHGAKKKQIEAYGAKMVRILGSRSAVSDTARQAAEKGAVYASHVYLPFNLFGYATLAYELWEQLGKVPAGTIILPVGQGGLLLGLSLGFQSLKLAGFVQDLPRLVGVQARACAPLWATFSYGMAGLSWVSEGNTIADGIRVSHPVRGDAILRAIDLHNGILFAVDEEDIIQGRSELALMGLYVELTSAVVWKAIVELPKEYPDPIIVILTGSGLKNS
jgi:threonine synthase